MSNNNNNTNKKRKKKNIPKPVYHEIRSLNNGTIDSFYGFIVGVFKPKPTANDNLLKFVVADSIDLKINVSLFYSEENEILSHLQVGNIVRLDRAKITKEYGTFLAIGNITHARTHFNVVVITGDKDDKIEPLGSLPQFSFTDDDRIRVDQLRELWVEIKQHFVSQTQNVINRTPISDIDFNDPSAINVVGKVLVKSFSTTAVGKRLNLWIWDGTGDAYEVVDDQHRFGRLLDVLSWDSHKIPILDSINEGQWILFKKVQPNIYNGKDELKVQSNSDIIPVDKNDPVILHILEYHKSRVDDYIRIMNFTNNNDNNDNNNNNDNDSSIPKIPDRHIDPQIFLTETEYPSKNVTKINDIKSLDAHVPKKYKICAKLIQHIPMNIMNMTRPSCKACKSVFQFNIADFYMDSFQKCVNCAQENTIGYIYLLKFILEDDTGDIPVILYGEEAEKFFGLQAVNFYDEKDFLLRVENDIKRLKEGKEFYCCIKSYYVQDKVAPENIRYQIFDTKIKH
ncbi:hypothetical protein PPL_02687 [Heterostelium album PN500]|uniref:POT1A/B-like OB fold domain-containing protein n=1 Tax=Heterostelium pallidum (strain ATCC 26659 / Pp 5 / PN500) TaxID=670386 RepID=D3B2S3_HETP5|nr:hypothetical protein PPL_02687 [Heterostelium album PN500]EFA83621.1 hypothetical protein PPL_02687 [Heterostelium album PN500]|eukprot:XP_020435738.1 hypothetical protein PPL_02687 [Heterostelium album PN500]